MSEPNLQLSPARHSSTTVSPPSPESPWTRTPLQLSPSPTLLYQCIASLNRNEGSILSIAVLKGNVFTGSESKRIRVWRQADYVERGYLKTVSGNVCAMLAYGNLLFTAHKDNKVRLWRVSSNSDNFHSKKITSLPRSNPLWFFSSRKALHQQKDSITCIAYYHAEGLLYTCSLSKTVRTWRISDQRCIDSFVAHGDAINAIIVSQEDGFVFTCSSDGSIKVWRRVYGDNSHMLTMTLKFQLSPVNALALSTTLTSCYLYSASSDGFINFWEKEKVSGRFNHAGFLQGHQYSVLCLVAIEELIISGSEDTTIRVWRREAASSFHECLVVLKAHNGPVRCLATSLEVEKDFVGVLVFSASTDGTFKVWRLKIFPEGKKEEPVGSELNGYLMQYQMSPVLSPSWVEKKLQCS